MKRPYLIQRCVIQPSSESNSRIGVSLDLDYMGSAEFEFGAIPKAIKRMGEKLSEFRLDELTLKLGFTDRPEAYPVIVFNKLSPIDLAEYAKFLSVNRNDEYKVRTKEPTYFSIESRNSSYRSSTNFWWDIENDVMWSYDHKFMLTLPQRLKASVDFMNGQ